MHFQIKNILKSYHYHNFKHYFNVTNSPPTCKNRTLNEQRRLGSRNMSHKFKVRDQSLLQIS